MIDPAVLCVALALYTEARGEGVKGMKLVADVIHNRVLDKRWPSTYCGVVWQPYQFEGMNYAGNKIKDKASWKAALEISEGVVNSSRTPRSGDINHFHTKQINPWWSKNFNIHRIYKNHIFYNDK